MIYHIFLSRSQHWVLVVNWKVGKLEVGMNNDNTQEPTCRGNLGKSYPHTCSCSHICLSIQYVHASCTRFSYLCMEASSFPLSPHSLDSVASCWTTKVLRLPNEPAHICLQSICNIFYSGVCGDSTTVFAGKSASTCVREQARACARHLIDVPVNWCVSCAEKDENNFKEQKSGVSLPRRTKVTRWTRWLTETWHMHSTTTAHLDICIVRLRDHLYCQKALQEQKTCWELSDICGYMFGCSQVCFTKEKCLEKQSN